MAALVIVHTASGDRQRRRIRTCLTLAATFADLENWLAVAAPGDAFAYYNGFLAMDRGIGSRLGEDSRKELCRVADTVMALAQSGHGYLLQYRHGVGDYSYLFVARGRPDRGTAALLLTPGEGRS